MLYIERQWIEIGKKDESEKLLKNSRKTEARRKICKRTSKNVTNDVGDIYIYDKSIKHYK